MKKNLLFTFILLWGNNLFCQNLHAYWENAQGSEKLLWGYSNESPIPVIPAKYQMVNPKFSEGLAAVQLNGLWGYIDTAGKEVISVKLDCLMAGYFSEGLACIFTSSGIGYIDRTGNFVIKPILQYEQGEDATKFYANSFLNGFAIVKKNGYSGFIDKTGKEVVPTTFESLENFSEGLAPAYRNKKAGFINPVGKIIVDFKYNATGSFSEGLCAVSEKEHWGYIDKTGKLVIPMIYESAEAFDGGLAIVKKNGLSGFINSKGEEVIAPQYESCHPFINGLAAVSRKDENEQKNSHRSEKGLFGFIDKSGKEVIPLKYKISYIRRDENDKEYFFENGRFKVKYDNNWGYINQKGEVVIPLKYIAIQDFHNGFASASIIQDGKTNTGVINRFGTEVIPFIYDDIGIFYLSFTLAVKDGKTGLIDTTGKVLLPIEYERVDALRLWLDPKTNPIVSKNVKRENRDHYLKGVFSRSGKELIPLIYDEITYFPAEDVYKVSFTKDNYSEVSYSYLDSKGKPLTKVKYSGIGEFKEGMVLFWLNGKYGYIDQYGKEVIKPQYTLAQDFKDGFAKVVKDGREFLIDKTGKEVTR